MTAEEFRSIAISLPEALEDEHMGHPDFRVRGKIFATLGPEERWGMVKLTPEQQAVFVRAELDFPKPISRRALAPVCLTQTGASALRLIAACFTSGRYCDLTPYFNRWY